MGSPWDVATVPTRHLRDVIGSGVCYLGCRDLSGICLFWMSVEYPVALARVVIFIEMYIHRISVSAVGMFEGCQAGIQRI